MYLILRPLGGFNDILCTIYRAYLYAAAYNRRLIVHTAHSSANVLFADGIQEYFTSSQPGIQLGMPVDAQLSQALGDIIDSSSSLLPWKEPLSTSSSRRLLASLDRGYHDRILLYEAFGGGYFGVNALNLLTLRDDVKKSIGKYLGRLPVDFNAIHCRYSDYKSDLMMLDEQFRQLSADKIPIYFATDSANLLRRFQSKDYGVPILNFCTTYSGNSEPIHHSKIARTRAAVEELLAELAILTLAKKFNCPLLSNPSDPLVLKSGFSILAENLRKVDKSLLFSYFVASSALTDPGAATAAHAENV